MINELVGAIEWKVFPFSQLLIPCRLRPISLHGQRVRLDTIGG
jgi:hypothetical protein